MSEQKQRLETVPQPKFKVGDTVFAVYTRQTIAQHPCPDCLGTKKWKVITKAGHEMECSCCRCDGWRSSDIPSLSYTKHVPTVQKLTIGSVRVDTAPSYGDDYVSYMCQETGIGSGSVYYENKLFDNEEIAQKEADSRVADDQSKEDAQPHAIEGKYFSAITLKDAALEAAKSSIWDSWYTVRCLREEIEEFINENALSSDQQSELESKINWSRDYRESKMPMGKIIELLKEGKAAEALAVIPTDTQHPPHES